AWLRLCRAADGTRAVARRAGVGTAAFQLRNRMRAARHRRTGADTAVRAAPLARLSGLVASGRLGGCRRDGGVLVRRADNDVTTWRNAHAACSFNRRARFSLGRRGILTQRRTP